jgi:outer membrane immunogenic protein
MAAGLALKPNLCGSVALQQRSITGEDASHGWALARWGIIMRFGRPASLTAVLVSLSLASLSLASLSIAASTIALAADPPRMAPVVTPYNWTGFYIGAHAGWRHLDSDGIVAFGDPAVATGLVFGALSTPAFSHALTGRKDSDAGIVGLQGGYNRQFAPNWLLGVEADASFGRNTVLILDTASSAILDIPFNVDGTRLLLSQQNALLGRARLDWNGSLRGRLGFVQDQWLFFVTGGLAFAGARIGGAESQTLSLSLVRLGVVLGSASATTRVFNSRGETLYGWTAGGGVEYAINRNWTIRGEYLYADYGDLSVFLPALPVPNAIGSASRFDFITHTARVALNYRF